MVKHLQGVKGQLEEAAGNGLGARVLGGKAGDELRLGAALVVRKVGQPCSRVLLGTLLKVGLPGSTISRRAH